MGKLKLVNENEDLKNQESKDSLINPEHFKSIRLKISMSNLTAKTEIRGDRKDFKESPHLNPTIELIEFLERGLALDVPPHVCAVGHRVLVDLKTEGAKAEIAITVTGKIETLEKLPTGRETIRVIFTQVKESEWQALQKTFSERQAEIFDFFKAVKE